MPVITPLLDRPTVDNGIRRTETGGNADHIGQGSRPGTIQDLNRQHAIYPTRIIPNRP